jgi:periplasmic divalent cation tolerance protein
MRKIAMLYTTFPTEEAAKQCIKRLLERKLIACANITDSQSLYVWNDAKMEEFECIVIAKTSIHKISEAIVQLKTNHPYELPCVLNWEVDSTDEYSAWVEQETN